MPKGGPPLRRRESLVPIHSIHSSPKDYSDNDQYHAHDSQQATSKGEVERLTDTVREIGWPWCSRRSRNRLEGRNHSKHCCNDTNHRHSEQKNAAQNQPPSWSRLHTKIGGFGGRIVAGFTHVEAFPQVSPQLDRREYLTLAGGAAGYLFA